MVLDLKNKNKDNVYVQEGQSGSALIDRKSSMKSLKDCSDLWSFVNLCRKTDSGFHW